MRKIRGLICIAVSKSGGFFFGKNMGGGRIGAFENFQTNGLTPFVSLAEAEVAKEEIRMISDFKINGVSIIHIEMGLAETMQEIYSLRRKRNLIVVRKDDNNFLLIGKLNEKFCRYPLYGSLLQDNGMQPFNSFKNAEWTAKEENRQSGCPVFMATLKIKRL